MSWIHILVPSSFSFFFNDTATTEIYTLSLHDALPIFDHRLSGQQSVERVPVIEGQVRDPGDMAKLDVHLYKAIGDRKSTRLNSSHSQISYAVFCLKKKKKNETANLNKIKVIIKNATRS